MACHGPMTSARRLQRVGNERARAPTDASTSAFEAARFAPGVRARAVETVRECCEDEDEEEEEEEMAEREPVAV